jgi:DNA-binding response OmpR family regulator
MRVLVIDDDIGMTDLLTILLTPASFEVITANTAQQGIETLESESPDVVILDLMLPEAEGWKICRSIREISNVPLLILSAFDSPGMVAHALDNGADDYLTKPFSSGTLIARLHKLVRRQSVLKKTNPVTKAAT